MASGSGSGHRRTFDKRGSLIRGESALVCFKLSVGGFFRVVEQHDLGLLIVGDIRLPLTRRSALAGVASAVKNWRSVRIEFS